ncbi:MAG TPA: bifunctional riboflavin kinase/FAD synthetase [Verrucomicrobiae bacterium]|nr:bifunctional riboflavin kinase/FAD synthetase [Verrucomicrobiae bacterium]
MTIVHTAKELSAGHRQVCLAIGFFDGVHLGHQQIIRQTIADARQHNAAAAVLTFDQHPNSVVAPARVPPLIYSLTRKISAIRDLGPDLLLLIHFDAAFSQQPAETFIRRLAQDSGGIRTLCVGGNFTFGKNRGGNIDLLKKIGAELGFSVHAMAAISLDGNIISSTRIRNAIRSGDLNLASQMLGRPYSLAAPIIPGDRVGRTLGFPTANLDISGVALPPVGVYAASAIVRSGTYRAVVNIGFRPTLREKAPTLHVEAHILGLHADLYGEAIELIFLDKLRDEKKFASLKELKEQIARDVENAKSR